MLNKTDHLSRIRDFLFGYDVFISFTHIDGELYAKELERELREHRYHCFLDLHEYHVGDDLNSETLRRVGMSTTFIVVGSPSVCDSPWVLKEAEAFLEKNRNNTRRRIFPIDIDNTLRGSRADSELGKLVAGRLAAEDTISALTEGPSEGIVREFLRGFDFARVEHRRRNYISIFTGVLLLLAALFWWRTHTTKRNMAIAYVNKAQSAVVESRNNQAVLFAAQALTFYDHPDARRILLELAAYGLYAELPGHPPNRPGELGGVQCLHLSGDGMQLASSGWDHRIRLWDVITGKEVATFPKQDDMVFQVRLSTDGNLLASSSWNGRLRLWNPESGAMLHELKGRSTKNHLINIEFTPDGTTLISAGDREGIQLWETTSGELRQGVPLPTVDSVKNMTLNPEGSMLAIVHEGITLWNLSEGREIHSWIPARTQEYLGPWISSIAFSPESQYLATGTSAAVAWIWSLDGQLKRTLSVSQQRTPDDTLEQIAFTVDSTGLVAAKADGSLIIWNVDDGSLRTLVQASEENLTAVAVHPEGSLIFTGGGNGSISGEDAIRVWDSASLHKRDVFRHTDPFDGGTSEVVALAIRPDGRRLAVATEHGEIYLWNLDDHELVHRIDQHDGKAISWIEFSNDSTFLNSVSEDYTARLWDGTTGEQLPFVRKHEQSLYGSAFSPDNRFLATGPGYGPVKLWNIKTGASQDLPFTTDHVYEKLVFTPDGAQLIAMANDESNIFIWSRQTGTVRSIHTGHRIVSDFDLGPSGDLLATCNEDIRLWTFSDATEWPLLRDFGPATELVTFSPDGRWLASADLTNIVRLWRVRDGREIAVLRGHGERHIEAAAVHSQMEGIAFSPDGRVLATGARDGTVRLWDLEALTGDARTLLTQTQLMTRGRIEDLSIGRVKWEGWAQEAAKNNCYQQWQSDVARRLERFATRFSQRR